MRAGAGRGRRGPGEPARGLRRPGPAAAGAPALGPVRAVRARLSASRSNHCATSSYGRGPAPGPPGRVRRCRPAVRRTRSGVVSSSRSARSGVRTWSSKSSIRRLTGLCRGQGLARAVLLGSVIHAGSPRPVPPATAGRGRAGRRRHVVVPVDAGVGHGQQGAPGAVRLLRAEDEEQLVTGLEGVGGARDDELRRGPGGPRGVIQGGAAAQDASARSTPSGPSGPPLSRRSAPPRPAARARCGCARRAG